ncbi:hypothetical protein QQS21_004416 [Conoideocrella luteorostrata]|uniref:Secreted protein n=1 Tax=Conoideocrella luteorostrata TaxID=1105319 RepID=A0AAJ0CRB7_9HYPO|nr:hypothetical protein QQS21_004416 [Conoideocrella luteorostrata]
MSTPRCSPTARILFSALVLVAILWAHHPSTSQAEVANFSDMADRSIADPIANLEVSTKQTSSSPPAIQVSVTNRNAYPVTVLSYDSPLDSMALRLGLISITPEGSEKPLHLPELQVRRMWPPPSDALIEIAPGKSAAIDIIIGGRGFDEEILRSVSRASLTLAGTWQAVWAKEKGSIADINLGGVDPDTDVYRGAFASENLVIKIS